MTMTTKLKMQDNDEHDDDNDDDDDWWQTGWYKLLKRIDVPDRQNTSFYVASRLHSL